MEVNTYGARRLCAKSAYKESSKTQEKGQEMIVKVIPSWRKPLYKILLKQGVQSFLLDYEGDQEDCRWYAKMFRKALRNSENAKKVKK
jgi:hypothetical protein